MDNATTEKQEYHFQAETNRLLHLLAHSLYQSKEIAIRELVSNASDALDKMRYLSLTREDCKEPGPLEIVFEIDEPNSTLVLRDTGIGMTRQDMVENLGTIARSGSLEFVKGLSGDQKKDVSLIGQFGVGFYSSFMLADRVLVYSRSYQDEQGHLWESDGLGSFEISPVEGLERGTKIVLKLKDDIKDLLAESRLKEIIKRYSSFIPHPIKIGETRVNDVRPIWVEPKSQLTQEQYDGFYDHLSHRSDEKPLWHLHFSGDSPIQFHALMYCPPSNMELLGFGRIDHGIHLCAKRVLVQGDCRELLPEYLRFLYGIVDSEDLPLNISRESLQDNTVFRRIRSTIVKKVLDKLIDLGKEDADKYAEFYGRFGTILKEGMANDFENRDRLTRCLRFRSSHHDDANKLVSLEEYVSRMKPDQKEIYYVGGPDVGAIQKNPNLEIFRKRGLEVFYLIDAIDEFVVAGLSQFEEKPLKSIDSADLELPASPDDVENKDETPTGGFAKVIDIFKATLSEKVSEVRVSKRLTDSPVCLVNAEGAFSAQMQKLMRMANKEFPVGQRILEVNPDARLIKQLSNLSANPQNEPFIAECGQQLFANALLLEGVMPEPEDMVPRVQKIMEEAAEKMSPLIL